MKDTPAHPSNAIEIAHYDVTYAMARVMRSCKGRYDTLNPALALKAIAETEQRLAKLKALCEEDAVVRKEAAKVAAKEAREFRRKQEVEKRRREREAIRASERAKRAYMRKLEREAKAAEKAAAVVQAPVVEIETGKVVAFRPQPVQTTTDYAAEGLVAMVRAQREHDAETRAERPSLLKRMFKKAA